MKEKKLRKVDYYEMLEKVVMEAGVENEVDLLTFINDQKELLTRKQSKANSKRNEEAKAYENMAYDTLKSIGRPATATEVANATNGAMSSQRASAYLKKLKDAGVVTRDDTGKSVLFAISE